MRCPLKEAIIASKHEYVVDPEKVGWTALTIICSVCGHSVGATLGRESSGKKIQVYPDSCQDTNPVSTNDRGRNRVRTSEVIQPRNISNSWINLIFGCLPRWINPNKGEVAYLTNRYEKIQTEIKLAWDDHDTWRAGGKKG